MDSKLRKKLIRNLDGDVDRATALLDLILGDGKSIPAMSVISKAQVVSSGYHHGYEISVENKNVPNVQMQLNAILNKDLAEVCVTSAKSDQTSKKTTLTLLVANPVLINILNAEVKKKKHQAKLTPQPNLATQGDENLSVVKGNNLQKNSDQSQDKFTASLTFERGNYKSLYGLTA